MTSVRPPAGLTLCLIAFICEGESALAQFGRWHKYASVPTTITSDRIPQDPRDLAPQPVPHGYTMSTDTDCGYPVCLTLQPRAAGACGIYGPGVCNWTAIAETCDRTPGCEGFNSNGWLKACLPPRCPAGASGMENTTASDLFTKLGPPMPVPPAPPVADWSDPFYPVGEANDTATAAIPSVVSVATDASSCSLRSPDGTTVSAGSGDQVFENWTILSILQASSTSAAVVVLQRRFPEWSLIIYSSVQGEVLRLRKPVGTLETMHTPTYTFPADYFIQAASDPNDYIGTRIRADSDFQEASYDTAAKYLPPIADYVIIGSPNAPVKASVSMHGNIRRTDGGNNDPPPLRVSQCTSNNDCMDRQYCVNGTCHSGGTTLFSASSFLGVHGGNYTMMQTGVLGGYLRVASVACYDPANSALGTAAVGFEMIALGPLAEDNDTIVIAIRKYQGPDAPANATVQYVEVSLNQLRCNAAPCPSTSARFYSAVLNHGQHWEAQFKKGMDVTLPFSERRQVDMAKGVLVASSTVWIGDEPNYGTGGDYWRSSPPRRAMMDTSGIAGSLPLTSLSLDTALLQWGLTESALDKVGFYVDTFVFPNGTIDMGHWKDIWPDGGDGIYNCTFPDGLSDHGRVIQMFADAVRMTGNVDWMVAHLAPVLRIGEYLLRSREEATSAYSASDPRHGIVYGPAEHDTCTMGMGTSPPEYDGQLMLYYFSTSQWHWRGMVELGQLLVDYPNVHVNQTFAKQLLAEASRFKTDIDAALARSVVRSKNGTILFVPAAVAPTGVQPAVYPSMTNDILSSYSNFRYYSEMLGSFEMDTEVATALMNFRETNGGLLSGMTRFTDHLDDMPALGYAESSIAYDRIEQFLLLLYGHAANYQGRGSFFSTEQMSLYQGSPSWRASLGEIQADFCVPSQTLVASMTAMQLVYSDRDARTLWLARAAPRRWYAVEGGGFAVRNAPSLYGDVSYTITPQSNVSAVTVLTVDARQLTGTTSRTMPAIRLRIRDPSGKLRLSTVVASPHSDCAIVPNSINKSRDTVDIQASPIGGLFIQDCTLTSTVQ